MGNTRVSIPVRWLFAALVATLLSVPASASYIELMGAQPNDGSIDLPPNGFTATYSPASAVASIWFSSSISPQNVTSIAQTISSQFGVDLELVGQNDSFSSGSISLGSAFDVLAVHLGGAGGGNELLFFFDAPITSFDVMTFSQGGSNNLSNFRAYSTGVVPVPAAMWLLASALLGFVRLRRK